MRRFPVLVIVALASMAAAQRDKLVQARQLYNQQRYDAAIEAATEARRAATLVDGASLVLARAYIERFRQTANAADLSAAREALTQIRAAQLTPLERIELVIGLGESLYLDGRFGAAAEEFELALTHINQAEPSDARVIEWWASALDRQAQLAPAGAQEQPYVRILQRMEEELSRDAGSAVASYWLVAAARGAGDLQRAWDSAIAAWIRAPLSGERAATLRDDLDRLVKEAVIPERARQFSAPTDVQQAMTAMRTEWETLKQTWTAPNTRSAP